MSNLINIKPAICAIALSVSIISAPLNANAASKSNAKIIDMLKNALPDIDEQYHVTQTKILDLTGDKRPEMIIVTDWAGVSQVIYGVVNGEVKEICVIDHSDFDKVWKKSKVISSKGGHMGEQWVYHYRFEKGEYKLVAAKSAYGHYDDYVLNGINLSWDDLDRLGFCTYKIKGKKVSRKRYNAYIKELTRKDKKPRKLRFSE